MRAKNAKRRPGAANGGDGAAPLERFRAVRFRWLRGLRASPVVGPAFSRAPASKERGQASVASAPAALQKGRQSKIFRKWILQS